MSEPRGCDSCGADTAFIRRVRCARCDGQVHPGCRDEQGVCYGCNWMASRKAGGQMERPAIIGPNPYLKPKE